jgi:hypothetical protein
VTTGPRWRKSSYSATGSDCVEVAPTAEQILMRNSKRPDEGTIAFPPTHFARFSPASKTASGATSPSGRLLDPTLPVPSRDDGSFEAV